MTSTTALGRQDKTRQDILSTIAMTDPNFPPNLDIKPLLLTHDHPHGQVQSDNQTNAIAAYGIAGRIW